MNYTTQVHGWINPLLRYFRQQIGPWVSGNSNSVFDQSQIGKEQEWNEMWHVNGHEYNPDAKHVGRM